MRRLSLMLACGLLAFTSLQASTLAARKEIALTIDDLIMVGGAGKHPGKLRREERRFKQILATLKQENVPVVGFVLTDNIEQGQMPLLEEFAAQGGVVANHSDTHPSANKISADKFIANVDKADKILAPFMKSGTKYFRFPYLATSDKNCKKANAIYAYLKSKNYIIAPVSLDIKDYSANASFFNTNWRVRKQRLNAFRQSYLNRSWRLTLKAEAKAMKAAGHSVPLIMLIHSNGLNAEFLPDLISMYKQRGYTFVTLDQAMQDPYYHYDGSKEKIPGMMGCIKEQPLQAAKQQHLQSS